MSVLSENLLLGADAAAGGYSIPRSLRFNSSDSAYLSRTPASAGNRKTFTYSLWVKKAKNGSLQPLYNARQSGDNFFNIWFDTGDTLNVWSRAAVNLFYASTNAVFRDPSAWYHVVVSIDTTQATDTNGIKIYVNGVQQALSISVYTQNSDTFTNSTYEQRIGYLINTAGSEPYLNAFIADAFLIDGQQLTPSSFGAFDANGIWQPSAYSGSYGTNGFHLDFADNSAATAAALGKDTSGNGNNWTPNNLSVTAGAGNDSLVDSPTNGTASSGGDAGGTVVGNYCTWNPLNKGSNVTLTNGNLDTSHAGSNVHSRVVGTTGISSGKYYFEATLTTLGGQWPAVGVALSKTTDMATYVGAETGTFGYYGGGGVNGGGGGRTYSSYTTGDIIGVAIDLDNNRLTFYKNGSNAVTSGTTYENLAAGEVYVPAVSGYGSSAAWVLNAGSRPFAYAAPAGFKSLNTANLPTPTILAGNTAFDTKLYVGNGGSQSISGLAFSPDFVWIKPRSVAEQHELYDVVRGVNKQLYTDYTDAEGSAANGLTSFDSSGFTLGSRIYDNGSGKSYVSWCWDAGSSTVTNTAGSITSTVRANASAGFSIVTYTGTGSNATVGHGLGVAPSMFFIKNRTSGSSNSWAVYHSSANASPATGGMYLNGTIAFSVDSTWFNNTSPSSTVLSIGTSSIANASTNTYVCYAFAPVSGYSSAFSFTGNGSTDGPMCYLGFRPRLILLKRTDTTGDWLMVDTANNTYNLARNYFYSNDSSAMMTYNLFDILSNGFKLRDNFASWNASGGNYVGFAWAENPFSIARAR